MSCDSRRIELFEGRRKTSCCEISTAWMGRNDLNSHQAVSWTVTSFNVQDECNLRACILTEKYKCDFLVNSDIWVSKYFITTIGQIIEKLGFL